MNTQWAADGSAPMAAPASDNDEANTGEPRQGEPPRLPPAWRKLLLTVHLIVTVGLLGTDAVVIALGIAGLRGAEPATIYPAAHLVAGSVVVPLALLALATGLALGLLTPWGLFRHRWVSIKLILTATLAGLAIFLLAPRFGAAADTATATADAELPFADRLRLVLFPTAALSVLVLNVALGVYKPFRRSVR